MKLCFNEATSMGCSDLQQDLIECERNGYDLIEIRLDKLREYLNSHSIDELKEFFASHHIKPYAFNALEGINFRCEKDWEALMNSLDLFCEVGREINCDRVVIVPTPDVGNKTITEIHEDSIKAIHEIDARARRNGWPLKLALEFVGYPNLCINTFKQAYDIVQCADMDNVGIVLDCFHFHAMGSRLSDLERLSIEKLFILHIDDSEDLPVGALRDEHRLWPGDGVIDLNAIFSLLKSKGYNEMASVELFRPAYYKLTPAENIRVAREKSLAVLSPFWTFD